MDLKRDENAVKQSRSNNLQLFAGIGVLEVLVLVKFGELLSPH